MHADYFSWCTQYYCVDQHGKNGPIHIESGFSPMIPIWYEAGKILGYTVGDPNGPQKEGTFIFHCVFLISRNC